MIFDSHACRFRNLREDAGFADRDQLERRLQLAMADHFQPKRRVPQGALADSTGLAERRAGA